ncbi:MAG TPA: sigma-70 family RNA polymerase sigma factor [Gemmatimonadales bacterium]|nr:sigma-70 family RNA polymerase sigma factor [Gemmatimonadales bacterium]
MSKGDVTGVLREWNEGDDEARKRLIPLVYRELRRLAARSLRSERPDHTLQPTALVHEAYQKLADAGGIRWKDRAHFFAVTAGIMRRILVDHARKRAALRRGGKIEKVPIEEPGAAGSMPDADVIAVDEALSELVKLDPRQARIVELRFFAGLNTEEAAEAMGVSRATVQRDWTVARAWLRHRLEK